MAGKPYLELDLKVSILTNHLCLHLYTKWIDHAMGHKQRGKIIANNTAILAEIKNV